MNKKIIIVEPSAINNIVENVKIRKWIYATYAILGVVIGSLQIGFTGYEVQWLEIVVNIYTYLALPVGALAVINSPTKQEIKEISNDEKIHTHLADS